jgi:isocitrate lyase
MFQLDDNFLQEIGLANLPEEQKQPFLEHIYSQLEMRVGTRLSDGLSDEQLGEFEAFIDRNEEAVRRWIGMYTPNYTTDEAYTKLQESAPQGTSQLVILAEYASLKWLSLNRPDYRDVVKQVLDEIKTEVVANRDAILGQ